MHLLLPELLQQKPVFLWLLDHLPAILDLCFMVQWTGDSHPLHTNIVVPGCQRVELGEGSESIIECSWEGG